MRELKKKGYKMIKLTRMTRSYSHGLDYVPMTTFDTGWSCLGLLRADPRQQPLYEIPEEDFVDTDFDFPNEETWMDFQVHAQDQVLPIYDDYARVLGENTHREGVPF